MTNNPSTKFVPVRLRAILATHAGWGVAFTADSDPRFSFTRPAAVQSKTTEGYSWEIPRVEYEATEVLDSLFKVDDTESALDFFRAYGPMDLNKLHGNNAGDIHLSEVRSFRDMRKAILLSGSTQRELQKFQRFREQTLPIEEVRAESKLPASESRQIRKNTSTVVSSVTTLFDLEARTPPPVLLTKIRNSVIGTIESKDIREATRAALFLDNLSGFGWAECEECEHLYKKRSRHHRKYCSEQCTTYASTAKKNYPDKTPEERREEYGRRSPGNRLKRAP